MAAAAVLVIAVLGFELLPAIAPFGPAPSPSASPSPSPTPHASPSEPVPTNLPAGSYSLQGYPVGISFTVPAGWTWCSAGPLEEGVCRADADGGVGFLIVANVVADPCTDVLRNPPVGPSVEDLVAAISGLADFTVTPPVDIQVDGFAGRELTVNPPKLFRCSTLLTWATPDRINGVGGDESNLIRIVDVDGTRVVMTGTYQHLGSETGDAIPAIKRVMDSVTFTP
jgi:hypothetical protein